MAKTAKNILPRGTVVPNHIVLIPDGNRRWARAQGLSASQGHDAGAEMVLNLSKQARDWGVHTVTYWGLSTENWKKRSAKEVDFLIKLFTRLVKNELKDAKKEGARIVHLGRKNRLPRLLMKEIEKAEKETENNQKHIINIALDYGGQDEIVRAVKRIVADNIKPHKIDEKLLDSYMDTAGQPYPYPDLVIRTSGEQRTSGILIWQSAYSEYYWETGHLPDFTTDKLKSAILDYSRRRRRFGSDDKEKHFTFKPEVAANLELAWWRLRNIPEGTRLRDYAMQHLKEQYGMSKSLAKDAALLMIDAVKEGNQRKWKQAKKPLKEFYKLIKDEMKLAFEPSLVASLEIKLWKDMKDADSIQGAGDIEETAKELYAEVYRISLFQAAKLAHLRVLAGIERNLAEKGMGDHHWERAEDYLHKFYSALKERVA